MIRLPCFALLVAMILPVDAGQTAFAQGADGENQRIGVMSEAEGLARQLFVQLQPLRETALSRIVERGKTDVVPALVQALRFAGGSAEIARALNALTGADIGPSWNNWMLWQEAHPEVTPFDGFDRYKADLMAGIDPNFRLFLKRGVTHEIRLEEIVWGGVSKDGIPALVNPKHIAPKEATYLEPDELVFGVSINGDVRAYPLRIMDWHEMFNDVVGGKPVALAYCTLCGSGILFDTQAEGRDEPFVFGSSGFLYRSNKRMYDKGTNSLWNQFTGRPVVGELTGSGIELRILPVAITTWNDWLARNPDTKVLSIDTGYNRDYSPGKPYGEYFASEELMFPAMVRDDRLKPKDYVFAVRTVGAEKAWPLAAFSKSRVINDEIGDTDVVLIGDALSRTVRAYRAEGRTFKPAPNDGAKLIADDGMWAIEEHNLLGPNGRKLTRLAGHIAYWFAWQGYKPSAELAAEDEP